MRKRRLKGWRHVSCTVRGWGRKVVDILYSFSPLNTQSERLLDFVNNSCFISFHLAWDVRCAFRCVIYFSNRNTSPRSTGLWVITELCLFSKEDANDRIKYVAIGCSSVIPNLFRLNLWGPVIVKIIVIKKILLLKCRFGITHSKNCGGGWRKPIKKWKILKRSVARTDVTF